MQYRKDQTAPWHEPRSTESDAKQDDMAPAGGLAQTIYYILLTSVRLCTHSLCFSEFLVSIAH